MAGVIISEKVEYSLPSRMNAGRSGIEEDCVAALLTSRDDNGNTRIHIDGGSLDLRHHSEFVMKGPSSPAAGGTGFDAPMRLKMFEGFLLLLCVHSVNLRFDA
jgi:hypothetical protein